MNIILFRPAEVQLPLPRRDPRAVHILDVLGRRPGESFDAGLIDGPRGKGHVVAVDGEALTLSFAWAGLPPRLRPVSLIVGLCRPQTARDILREATALGVSALHFVRTEKGEASYATSSLWKSGAWEECVINGAAQAFCTRLPEVTHGRPLAEVLAMLTAPRIPGETGAALVALDNYESPAPLSQFDLAGRSSVVLAVGPERGWSAAERDRLRASGFVLAHLGERVLRTETACVAAITLLLAKLGCL